MTLDQSDEQYQLFIRRSEFGNLVDLWLATHYASDGADIEHSVKFGERRDAFIWVLERLLREGRIKLHKKGKFLESPIEEQIQAFRNAWPVSVEATGYKDFYWWFFDPVCPAGVAWRLPDGTYEIED